MKQLLTILLILFSFHLAAQDCTREIAQSIPTILEKGFDKKPYAVKDAYGKRLGDSFYPIFANAIQQSKGLDGNFGIAEDNFKGSSMAESCWPPKYTAASIFNSRLIILYNAANNSPVLIDQSIDTKHKDGNLELTKGIVKIKVVHDPVEK